MEPVQIGDYKVAAESETFRIFPKGRDGRAVPVTRINNFIYLTCVKSGQVVTFKRFLHQKKWYWRDSRDVSHCSEHAVICELSRMLGLSREKAKDVALAALTGAAIAA